MRRQRCVNVIGVASGVGAQYLGCADGPLELQSHGILLDLAEPDIRYEWDELIRLPAA